MRMKQVGKQIHSSVFCSSRKFYINKSITLANNRGFFIFQKVLFASKSTSQFEKWRRLLDTWIIGRFNVPIIIWQFCFSTASPVGMVVVHAEDLWAFWYHYFHLEKKIQPSVFPSRLSSRVDCDSCLDNVQVRTRSVDHVFYLFLFLF